MPLRCILTDMLHCMSRVDFRVLSLMTSGHMAALHADMEPPHQTTITVKVGPRPPPRGREIGTIYPFGVFFPVIIKPLVRFWACIFSLFGLKCFNIFNISPVLSKFLYEQAC